MTLPPLPGSPVAQLLPPLPIKPTTPAPAKWKLENQGKDRLRIVIDATLTRTDCFRLIGELERTAGFL